MVKSMSPVSNNRAPPHASFDDTHIYSLGFLGVKIEAAAMPECNSGFAQSCLARDRGNVSRRQQCRRTHSV
eukprot:5129029-Pleurochrysis_carterae.AAC.1